MNAKDLIFSLPAEEIASAVADFYDSETMPKAPDRAHVIEQYSTFIRSLAKMVPIDTNSLLLGVPRQEDDRSYLDACLIKKAELAHWDRHRFDSLPPLEELSRKDMEDLCALSNSPETYAFEFSPWAEVLGFEICPQNAAEVGEAQLAAQILWEMTFFGFTEDQISEERKKLEGSIREVDEIKKLPPEEQEKRLISAEDLFAELGYEDTRTEEEKEEQYVQMCRQMVLFQMRLYRGIEQYLSQADT
jgi:hypothetical protein